MCSMLGKFMLKTTINSKLAWVTIGILLIGALYLLSSEFLFTNREMKDLISEIDISEIKIRKIQQEKVLYIIDKGNGNINSYQISLPQNSTVFSLLEELAKRENFKVESKVYEGMGVFVESIDGVKNGTENKYWQYWVNGELPPVAADKKEVKKGDKVEWKFAPSSF